METTNTPISTPAQRQALRRYQHERLRNQAEALLRAIEALEPPQTYKEAEQAAKTLLAASKVLDAVNDVKDDDERIVCASVRPPEPAAEAEALNSYTAFIDRSLGLLAEVRAARRQASGG